MTDREKLFELIGKVQDEGVDYTDVLRVIPVSNEMLVDYLIVNGVVVQKHGQWEIIGMRPVGTRNTHYCSLCGCHGTDEMRFCPGCGAKMDLEE